MKGSSASNQRRHVQAGLLDTRQVPSQFCCHHHPEHPPAQGAGHQPRQRRRHYRCCPARHCSQTARSLLLGGTVQVSNSLTMACPTAWSRRTAGWWGRWDVLAPPFQLAPQNSAQRYRCPVLRGAMHRGCRRPHLTNQDARAKQLSQLATCARCSSGQEEPPDASVQVRQLLLQGHSRQGRCLASRCTQTPEHRLQYLSGRTQENAMEADHGRGRCCGRSHSVSVRLPAPPQCPPLPPASSARPIGSWNVSPTLPPYSNRRVLHCPFAALHAGCSPSARQYDGDDGGLRLPVWVWGPDWSWVRLALEPGLCWPSEEAARLRAGQKPGRCVVHPAAWAAQRHRSKVQSNFHGVHGSAGSPKPPPSNHLQICAPSSTPPLLRQPSVGRRAALSL